MTTIMLTKGRVYRLAFAPSIKKGNWYFGVDCSACKKPVLVLDDSENGKVPLTFAGEGEFSIPCPHCGTDARYPGSAMKSYEASYDRDSFKDKRPAPSGSPRQPLVTRYPHARPTFGIGAIEQRPEAALIVARCIAYWTEVEMAMARLLAQFLTANTEPAIAVYLSLQNARAKRDAMDAAAETMLNDEDKLLYDALMAYKGAVEKERNALAHGVFGIAEQIPTGIVWTDTTRYTQFQARIELDGLTAELSQRHLRNCYVYEVGDLETIARDIENLNLQIGFFTGYLSGSDDVVFRARRYPQLCAEPRVQTELNRLRRQRSPKGQQ